MDKCSSCGSQDIKHEEKIGRGGPPDWYVQKYKALGIQPKAKISWKGTWDIWTCNECGEKCEKLK